MTNAKAKLISVLIIGAPGVGLFLLGIVGAILTNTLFGWEGRAALAILGGFISGAVWSISFGLMENDYQAISSWLLEERKEKTKEPGKWKQETRQEGE